MKKALLIIGLLLTIILVSSYNYPAKVFKGYRFPAYDCKTLEVMYDSKNRPHKIVIYSYNCRVTAIDLDANTYK